MRSRGFATSDLLIGLGGLLVLSGLVFGVMHYLDGIEQRGVERGRAEVQAKWDAANIEAAQKQRAKDVAVEQALVEADIARGAAEDKAKTADQRWKEVRRNAERTGEPLAVCAPPQDGAVAGVLDRGQPAVGLVPRFSDQFVREYDTAWTGPDGQPVFQAAAGSAGPADAGAVTAADIIDTHGENARRCSQDRREYAALISKIRAAAVAWDLNP